MATKDHKDLLVMDIETFSGEKPDPSTIKAPANYSKPEAIKKYQETNVDKEWRKQSLDPFKGRVWCIGYAVNDEETKCFDGTEKEVLTQFNDLLGRLEYPTIVAHNGLEFDFSFLFYGGLRYGLQNIIDAFKDSRSPFLVDTMRVMDGPSWKKMTSLDKMCKLLGYEGKGDIKGSMVHDMVLNGEYDKITEYCISDVDILRKSYLKLKAYGLC